MACTTTGIFYYATACVPLTSTGVKEEYVCGVRYRAWQPPSALHPTIGVDTPLTFDIVDTWNGRSVGGCTYYVSHPGGRSYDVYPINSYEAESRRTSRFGNTSHTQEQQFIKPGLRLPAIGWKTTGPRLYTMRLHRDQSWISLYIGSAGWKITTGRMGKVADG